MAEQIIVAACIGFAIGALLMWLYFARWSGLHRTFPEFVLARHLGPKWEQWCTKLLDELAKESADG